MTKIEEECDCHNSYSFYQQRLPPLLAPLNQASTFIPASTSFFPGKPVPAKGNDRKPNRHTGVVKNVNKSARGFMAASNSASVPEPI